MVRAIASTKRRAQDWFLKRPSANPQTESHTQLSNHLQPPPKNTEPPGANVATPPGDQPKAKFSRLTYSTFYRVITGHAFVGEYTQRFYSQHTPEQIACPCGRPLQTIEHVLLECPTYAAARLRHFTANGRPRTLPQLFENRARVLDTLRFLEETGALAKPRVLWDPE